MSLTLAFAPVCAGQFYTEDLRIPMAEAGPQGLEPFLVRPAGSKRYPLALLSHRAPRSFGDRATPFAAVAPMIVVSCAIGAYAIQNAMFDIWLMLGFGVVGYVFKKIGIPLAPFTLALVLGTRRIEKIGTIVNTSTKPTTLARYIEAIWPQTKSLCSTNSSGRGLSARTISDRRAGSRRCLSRECRAPASAATPRCRRRARRSASIRWCSSTRREPRPRWRGAMAVRRTAQVLVPTLRPGDIAVMDNLAAHKRAKVGVAIDAAGAQLLYRPPYSPDLNPIEWPSPNSKPPFERPPPDQSRLWTTLSPSALAAFPFRTGLLFPEISEVNFKFCGFRVVWLLG